MKRYTSRGLSRSSWKLASTRTAAESFLAGFILVILLIGGGCCVCSRALPLPSSPSGPRLFLALVGQLQVGVRFDQLDVDDHDAREDQATILRGRLLYLTAEHG